MSRKDYELLAAALASVRPSKDVPEELYDVWASAVDALARRLWLDNSSFKVAKFRKACEA